MTADRTEEQRWEQPTFDPAEPPVTGVVLTGVQGVPGAGARVLVAPPTQEEQTIATIRRLLWPVALVLAIVTGNWLGPLVLAIVVGGILRRRLWQLRVQRLRTAPDLR
ncbi:MAG: hypothetical protein QM779_15155 [Propionicimonas sp.]|uniref:hypothetical protein n=1 Tax=Propionicimonas sp. TaxID=1955623 RepID=UPI003D0EB52C